MRYICFKTTNGSSCRQMFFTLVCAKCFFHWYFGPETYFLNCTNCSWKTQMYKKILIILQKRNPPFCTSTLLFHHRAQKAHVSKVGEDWGGDMDENPWCPFTTFAKLWAVSFRNLPTSKEDVPLVPTSMYESGHLPTI